MVTFYYIILLLCTLVALVVGWYFGSEMISLIRSKGVPYVPLRAYQVQAVIDQVPVTAADVVYDLGCGDARVLRAFLRAGAGKAVGYEFQYAAIMIGKFKSWREKTFPEIRVKNFFSEPITEPTVVYIFLLPKTIEQLKAKFDKELRPGTRVVSYGFEIKNWRPATTHYLLPNGKNELDNIYIYTI